MVDEIPHPILKGRGATLNMGSRFDAEQRVAIEKSVKVNIALVTSASDSVLPASGRMSASAA